MITAARAHRLVVETLTQAGLSFPGVEVELDEVQERIAKITIIYRGDTTFEVLDQLSRLFGTRRIDLGVELGPPPSDPSVSPQLVISEPVVLGLTGDGVVDL
jgi:hypothetical protein